MSTQDRAILASCVTPARLALDALQHADNTIVFHDAVKTWNGSGTLACIATIQHALAQSGIPNGGRVALLSSNRVEAWCASVAAQALGYCITWLHPLGALDAHIFQIEDFQPHALIVDVPRYRNLAEGLAGHFERQTQVLTLGPSTVGSDLLQELDKSSVSPIDRSSPKGMAIVNYTGGTTGRSKGAVRRNAALSASTIGTLADFDISRGARFLVIGPISHVTGTKILPTLLRGGSITMLDRFEPDLVCSTIQERRINTTLLVPTMIYSLLDSAVLDRYDTSTLELMLYGASSISPTRLSEALDRFGPVFSQLYGQTECYPIAVLPREDHDRRFPDRLSACGFASSSCNVNLLDPEGRPVAPGKEGEICVRAPYVMEGYWNQPELTEEVFRGGWLHTGDVGKMDEAGRLYIVDRLKDMIITGGFNVYPREVEDVISSLQGVSAVAVLGVPDPKWGEAVAAAIVLSPGTTISPEDIAAAVKAKCGSVQTPKHIRFFESLPLTAAGKVDKKALKGGSTFLSETIVP